MIADLGRRYSLSELQNVSAAAQAAASGKSFETTRQWNEERVAIKENNRHVFLVHTIEPS